jgi:hypothetical protein
MTTHKLTTGNKLYAETQARAALAEAPLILSPHGWRYTRKKRARIFSHATINKLIAAGFAERRDDMVMMRGQNV